jgi:hypothetical protein
MYASIMAAAPLVVRVALAGALGNDGARAGAEGDAVPVTVADADHPLGTLIGSMVTVSVFARCQLVESPNPSGRSKSE